MHTLTKIFIVLQALLSVFILALVVPLAVNQDHWKAQYQKVKGEAEQTAAEVKAQQARYAAENTSHQKELASLNSRIADLEQQLNSKDQTLVDLRAQLGESKLVAGEARAQNDTLTATTKTQSEIIRNQGDEITSRRNESLEIQQRAIDLEDQLRDALTRLDVAVDATRILQEQLTQCQETKVAGGPGNGGPRPEPEPSAIPSPKVLGRILEVETDPSGTKYAVVNLGSRDGLTENMQFIVSRDRQFMAHLKVTNVDINRAVGRIELEQPGQVRVGDNVYGGLQ